MLSIYSWCEEKNMEIFIDINLVNLVAFVAVWTLISIPFGLLVARVFRVGQIYEEDSRHFPDEDKW